jgi:hypothetical protein
MKVLVCGGRDYRDYSFVHHVLSTIHYDTPITLLVQGGARGADTLAKRWAQEHNIPVQQYDAEWEKYGRAAGFIRNSQMLHDTDPDLVVAFPGGPGTLNMVQQAKANQYQVCQFQ